MSIIAGDRFNMQVVLCYLLVFVLELHWRLRTIYNIFFFFLGDPQSYKLNVLYSYNITIKCFKIQLSNVSRQNIFDSLQKYRFIHECTMFIHANSTSRVLCFVLDYRL